MPKKEELFGFLLFEATFTLFFKDKIVIKMSQNSRNQGKVFLIMFA
jgi:hypothetical protein